MAKVQVLSPIAANVAKGRPDRRVADKAEQVTMVSKPRRGSAASSSSKVLPLHESVGAQWAEEHALRDRRQVHNHGPRLRRPSFNSVSSVSDAEESHGRALAWGHRAGQTKKTQPIYRSTRAVSPGSNHRIGTMAPSSPLVAPRRTRHAALVEMFSPVRAMRVARAAAAGHKRKRGGGSGLPFGSRTDRRNMGTSQAPSDHGVGARSSGRNEEDGEDAQFDRQGGDGWQDDEDPLFLSTTSSRCSSSREVDLFDHSSSHHGTASPSSLRTPTLHPSMPIRPQRQSRENSSSSLRRNLRAMRLSDREEGEQPPAFLSSRRRSSTRSVTRAAMLSSEERASTSRQPSFSGSTRSMRSRRQSQLSIDAMTHDDDQMADGRDGKSGADDAEGEEKRMLHHAPSWQLRRLTKGQLFELHVQLGTFDPTQVVELDLYNKQDLVDGIIRSRGASEEATEDPTQQSSSASPAVMMTRSSTNNTIISRSSEYTDESDDDDDDGAGMTDANDAGGEETEVEPVKSSRRSLQTPSHRSPLANHVRAMRRQEGALRGAFNGGKVSFPMHLARSTEGSSTRSSSVMSPARRRLRHKGSLVFAASSPVRTRARTRHQSNPATTTLQGLGSGATLPFGQPKAVEDFDSIDTIMTPKPRRPRTRSTSGRGVGRAMGFAVDMGAESSASSDADAIHPIDETDEGQEHEWEDTSPTVARRRPMRTPRKAKVRAQKQLQGTSLEEDSEAIVESVLGGGVGPDGDDSDDMSVDETVLDVRSQLKRIERHGASPPLSEMSLDDTPKRKDAYNVLDDSDEDLSSAEELETDDGPSEIDASPSKIRRLRNGKVRMPTALVNGTAPQAKKTSSKRSIEATADTVEQDQQFSHATLQRLKRDRLVALCQQNGVEHEHDATRAVLIDALVAHLDQQRGTPASGRTQRVDSAGSNRTARPEDSERSNSSQTRRSGAVATTDYRDTEASPLLLRTRSLKHQTHGKPGTPTPSQNEEDLNGLDLESLQLVDKEIAFHKLEKMDKIGSGGFKDVYVGKYHISKKCTRKVAIADIRDQLSEMDIKELTLLRDLRHENIVRFIGVCIPPVEMRLTPCMIVTELCANGDLYDYIRNVAPPPDEEIFRIMLELARGLEYLHLRTPAIIHRDCKSTNVLITRNRIAKISDFGLARVRHSKRSMIQSLVGTVNWQAAELWTPKPNYNEKVDVWSTAMTFWEVLQWHHVEKKYPFQDMNEHQIYQDVGQKRVRPPTQSLRRRFGGEVVDLLDRMWDHNPKQRPTMTQVCTEMERLVAMKKEASAVQAMLGPANGTKKTAATGRKAS